MRRHRRKYFSKIWLIFFAVITIAVICIFIRLENAVRPSAQLQAEKVVKNTANRIITETVSEYISKNGCTYSDFALVSYDSEGRTSSIEARTENINRMQADLSAAINKRLADSKQACAKIPVGSLSGSYLLAGRGFNVNVRICPIGESEVKIKSAFSSVGINQTRHCIYAEISAELISTVPMYSFETEENFEFIIAETIIVGEVPEYSVKAWSS